LTSIASALDRVLVAGRAASVVGGLIAVALGGVLLFRPFASLAVLLVLVGVGLLALAALTLHDAPAGSLAARLLAVGYAAAGLAALFWPGLGLAGLVIVLGVALVVGGAARAVAGVSGTQDERLAAALGGSTDVVLGVLALAWPDVTLVVVAVLFGLKLVWVGLTALWRGVSGRRPDRRDAPTGRFARVGHLIVSAAGLVLALALTWLSSQLNAGAPVPDAFYDPPGQVPSQPGRLLRVEPFDRGLPDGAVGWRILHTTTRDGGEPAVSSALVVTAAEGPTGPRPAVAWAHGTTGAAEGCAPTLLSDPLGSGAAPGVRQVLENGWTLVATDYVGLGTEGPHPYLIGEGEARSVLDAVRAAQQMEQTDVAAEAVVWGHSQGGHAALWTGQLAPSYAPELEIRGVAALAPASGLAGLVGNLDVVPGGAIFASYVLAAYDEVYDDVELEDYVRATARIPVREMAGRCLAEPAVFVSVVETMLFDQPVFSSSPTSGALGERLRENTPLDPMPVPLFIGQGATDALVLPDAQAAYVKRRCRLGDTLQYRTYPGRDHVGVVADDSPLVPELVAWTRDRFAAKQAPSSCL
jgi:alpha-beta hydrolase superfamily lysophospholipase